MSGSDKPRISVVVPVYNGSVTLDELVRRCHEVLAECASAHELVLVNDGSHDGSWAEIQRLAAADPHVRGIDLARNYGQHNALLAGIRAARYELTITLDDDLQNPPEEIPVLLEALTPDRDVVYGEPIAKRQRLDRRLATNVVVWALHVLGGRTAPMVSAFRLFRTDLRDGFDDYTGPDVSIDALLTWRTERFAAVPVHHATRSHGSSNYSLLKLARHALTMITAFSTRPLQMASGLGFLVIIFGLVVLAYVVVRFAIEGGSVPGFPFLASIISIFSGAQLFAIGVIGEYLARVHVRVMARPSYRVRGTTAPASPAGAAAVEVLAWDSEFWGFPVARVEGERFDPTAAKQAAAWCDANGVRCAFLLAGADDAATAAAVEVAGFRPVDTRITLERRLADPGPADLGNGPAARIRRATEADRGALEELGAAAHTDARFFFDTHFPATRAADLYRIWATRGLTEPERDLVVAEADGELVGYLQTTDAPAEIDLIAVAERARGRGIGTALVGAAVARLDGQALRVVTQARNVPAMRLYESNGFRQVRAEVWYHRWA